MAKRIKLSVESDQCPADVTALVLACESGNVALAELLLLQPGAADVHACGDTALLLAWEEKKIAQALPDSAEHLKREIRRFEIRDGGADEPLLAACFEGHLKMVELLLQRGANVHARGGRALGLACMFDNVALAALLLKHGADANSTSLSSTAENEKEVPLALASNNLAMVQLLLTHGANPNVRVNEDYSSVTEVCDDPDILQLLLEHGGRDRTWNILEDMKDMRINAIARGRYTEEQEELDTRMFLLRLLTGPPSRTLAEEDRPPSLQLSCSGGLTGSCNVCASVATQAGFAGLEHEEGDDEHWCAAVGAKSAPRD